MFSLLSSLVIKGLDSANCGIFNICISLFKQKVSDLKKAADHMKHSSNLRTKEVKKDSTAKSPNIRRHEEIKVYPNERCKEQHARPGKVIPAKFTTTFKEDAMYT